MSIRYYNHVGFICGMPVNSDAKQRWLQAGMAHVLYSWGLRRLILVVPILASLLYPLVGPVAALLVVAMLSGFVRGNTRVGIRDPGAHPGEDAHREIALNALCAVINGARPALCHPRQ